MPLADHLYSASSPVKSSHFRKSTCANQRTQLASKQRQLAVDSVEKLPDCRIAPLRLGMAKKLLVRAVRGLQTWV